MLADFAAKGSQRWLQIAVDQHPESLNAPIRTALGLPQGEQINWLSPRREEAFIEYRDGALLTV